MKRALAIATKWSVALLVLAFSAAIASATSGTVTLCTETDSGMTAGDSANGLMEGGCVNSIPTSAPTLVVASDGEVDFDPFGFGADTSDDIALNSNWVANNDNGAFNTGFWTQFNGFDWALPGVIPGCGMENEPTCEPVGSWYFPGTHWLASTPAVLLIDESDGSLSDVILLNNQGPGGSAQILFSSDPSLLPQSPEPASLLLLGTGLLGLAGVLRRKLL